VGNKRGRPKKRGTPRQSAAPMAQQGRYLQQFVQPNQMIPSNQINPTIIPAPFGEPLVTNPSTLSFAPNAQPSIYRNARREAPVASRVNKSFAWSGKSGAMLDALPPTPTPLSAKQAASVSAAKAQARAINADVTKRMRDSERAMMAVEDADAFMMRTPLDNYGYRTPASNATGISEDPPSTPYNDPFPSPSSQGGGRGIMEGRSLFKN